MRRLVTRIFAVALLLLLGSAPFAARVASRFQSPMEFAAGIGLFFGVGGVIVTLIFLFVIFPRLEAGTRQITQVAERIADGDLRVGLEGEAVGGFRRQWAIVGRMVAALRRVAGDLRSSADDTGRVAGELAEGASTLGGIATAVGTEASDVRASSATMARAVAASAGDAGLLVELADALRRGAAEGTERNARMRHAATTAGTQLDQAGGLLIGLEDDVRETSDAVEALATAAEEIAAFTSLVQQIARQSRLLSLNAAMEAARAGEYGEGFAVVAAEVRRLAQLAADGADRTERIVQAVVTRVADSREKSARLAETLTAVTGATTDGVRAFGAVGTEVAAAERWTAAISSAALRADTVARELDRQLAAVAAGLDALARTTERLDDSVASQRQAAERQAALGARLSQRATALAALAAEFRLPGDVQPPGDPSAQPRENSQPARSSRAPDSSATANRAPSYIAAAP